MNNASAFKVILSILIDFCFLLIWLFLQSALEYFERNLSLTYYNLLYYTFLKWIFSIASLVMIVFYIIKDCIAAMKK